MSLRFLTTASRVWNHEIVPSGDSDVTAADKVWLYRIPYSQHIYFRNGWNQDKLIICFSLSDSRFIFQVNNNSYFLAKVKREEN